jgi:hypothetical protein
MKTTTILSILSSLASTVLCQGAAGYGSYIDPAVKVITVPSVWLYKGKLPLLSLQGVILSKTEVSNADYASKYSPAFNLSDECREDLIDYDGVWVEADPRPSWQQQGCGYSWQTANCTGDVDPIPIDLKLSGKPDQNFPGQQHRS